MTQEELNRFHDLCLTIIGDCPNEYARVYAEAGLNMFSRDECQNQAARILSQMGHWRGDTARETKQAIKELFGL